MSDRYPQWNLSNFPNYIDTQKIWSDMTAEEKPYADEYLAFIAANDFTSANALIADRPNLQKMIISALDLNTLQHQILATQAYYLDDVRDHIISFYTDRGLWDADTSDYVFGNYVTYEVDSVLLQFSLAVASCPAGTLPTNTAYWRQWTLQGKQGVGIGLTPAGAWVGTETYVVNNAVSHNNVLWRTLIENLNSEPTSSNTNWEQVMGLTSNTNIMTDEHTGTNYEIIVRDGRFYKRPTISFSTSLASLVDEVTGYVWQIYVVDGKPRARRIN